MLNGIKEYYRGVVDSWKVRIVDVVAKNEGGKPKSWKTYKRVNRYLDFAMILAAMVFTITIYPMVTLQIPAMFEAKAELMNCWYQEIESQQRGSFSFPIIHLTCYNIREIIFFYSRRR